MVRKYNKFDRKKVRIAVLLINLITVVLINSTSFEVNMDYHIVIGDVVNIKHGIAVDYIQ